MPTYCPCKQCVASGAPKRVAYAGCYAKGHEPPGQSNDPEGKVKAQNDRNNPQNNPANNAKRQKQAADEAEARISEFSHETVLSTSKAYDLVTEILNNIGEPPFHTGGVTLQEHITGGRSSFPPRMDFESLAACPQLWVPGLASIYLGYTSRTLPVEALRWLTVRGASQEDANGNFVDPSARNRPVLLWADGSTITMGQAVSQLGFEYFEIYASSLKINARYVECALQQRLQHLPLGMRLWRHPDKGAKFDEAPDNKVHKVFIAISWSVAPMLAEQKIKVNF